MRSYRELGVALIAGGLFGVGLIVSGMVDPDKVRGFLDVAGQWDPSLALVMGGAILVALPAFQWRLWRSADSAAPARPIDRSLILGSLIFGVGWGLSGYCPGPALVAAGGGNDQAIWYVLAMAAGTLLGAHSVNAADADEPDNNGQ